MFVLCFTGIVITHSQRKDVVLEPSPDTFVGPADGRNRFCLSSL